MHATNHILPQIFTWAFKKWPNGKIFAQSGHPAYQWYQLVVLGEVLGPKKPEPKAFPQTNLGVNLKTFLGGKLTYFF
jgi:hypothetical protein